MFRANCYTHYRPQPILALLGIIFLVVSSANLFGWHSGATGASPALASPPAQNPPPSQCRYCISPAEKSFTHEGGDATVTVTAPSGCAWAASSDDNFITITSGNTGQGNGAVSFNVAANTGDSRRVGSLTIAGHTFGVFQGVQFSDVPANHLFFAEIGKLSARGITLGCGGGNYCPDSEVTREQMAALIIRGLREFNPPIPAGQRFQDVPPSNIFYAFIDRLAVLGITAGCSANPPRYCPTAAVSREQLAALVVRALGEFNPPAPQTQRFDDVPPSNPFYAFIDRMAVLRITLGCSANPPLYCPSSPVTRGQMAAFLIRAFDQPMNSPPLASAGLDQTITLPSSASLSGLVTDDGLPSCALTVLWSQVSGPGTVSFSNPDSESTTAMFSAPGTYLLRLTASDSQASSSDDVSVTVNPVNPANQPPSVNAGPDQTITLPNTASLNGTVIDDGQPSNSLIMSWSKVSGPGTVIFSNASGAATTAMFSEEGSYVLRLIGNDSVLISSDEVIVTVNADPTPPPPAPEGVAPTVSRSVVTTLGEATRFLYSGPNPIQTGVAPGTISPIRAAVVRGRVKNTGGAPVSNVKITILNHPELGQTFSRADGMFDIAVNGDDLLTVKYEKLGLIPVQRQERVSWQEYSVLKDVVMMAYDDRVTNIDLNANFPIQVAHGSTSSDSAGARRATLFFQQGTNATMVLPNGSMQGLTDLHVRATEFTVGAQGPQAMPGGLPATSAYTYAVEYSVDEAVAAGAKSVLFSQPVISYLENFLDFPVGEIVPVGIYDREQAAWVPSANGRVIRIVSIVSGAAELDTDGDGAVDNGLSLGVTLPERQRLAELYAAGQSLWRFPINHFSPCDPNWPFGPPPDATGPPSPAPRPPGPDDHCEQPGSIIECQNQTLGERIGITGTPFSLNYRSDRVFGRRSAYMLDITLSGTSVPASLRRIETEVSVAGRVFTQSFAAAPNQHTTFTWDGQDAYGRTLQGSQPVTVRVNFVYGANYQAAARLASSFANFGNSIITLNGARQEFVLSRLTTATIGPFEVRALGLGGWTASVHHAYDPIGQTLHLGDGSRRSVSGLPQILNTVAGGGPSNCTPSEPCGDGGPATSAYIEALMGICVDGQGNLFIADTFRRKVRKVDTSGIITTVAGTGGGGGSGDGGPATQALFRSPVGVAVDAQGNLFIVDQADYRIRKVDASGIITTVAGTGVNGSSGDGGPATQAQLGIPSAVAFAPDGTFFIAEGHNVRRVSPDGIITSVPDPNNLIQSPNALALDDEGNLFIGVGRVLRLSPDGRITTVAGGGGSPDDGIPATTAHVQARGLAVDRVGNLYIADNTTGSRRVRVVKQGIITTVAGGGAPIVVNIRDGVPATSAFIEPWSVAVDERGNLLVLDRSNLASTFITPRVRRVGSVLPQFSGPITIASEDGSQLFNFDAFGRHLSTVNALTGATAYTFGYNSAARLVTITDGDGNVTIIERNANGEPMAIVAPFGQRTTLTVNSNGYLSSIANPAGETTQCGYSNDGLLTSFTDPGAMSQ